MGTLLKNYSKNYKTLYLGITTGAVIAGIYFGIMCKEIGDATFAILSGGSGLSSASLPLALALLMIFIGLLALLIQRKEHLHLSLLLTTIGIGIGWRMIGMGVVFLLLFFFATLYYCHGVRRTLKNRIHYTGAVLQKRQSWYLLSLVLLLCASIHFGGKRFTDQQGIGLPPSYVERIQAFLDEKVPQDQIGISKATLSRELTNGVDRIFAHVIKPQEQYLGWVIVLTVFFPLLLLMHPFSWIINKIVMLLLRLLRWKGVVKEKKEMMEVTRIVLE
jgi:hypothetical protein